MLDMSTTHCAHSHVRARTHTCSTTRSKPVTASVTVCSTCRRGLASMNQNSFSLTRNSTVQREERGGWGGWADMRRSAAAAAHSVRGKEEEGGGRACLAAARACAGTATATATSQQSSAAAAAGCTRARPNKSRGRCHPPRTALQCGVRPQSALQRTRRRGRKHAGLRWRRRRRLQAAETRHHTSRAVCQELLQKRLT